MVVTNSRVEGIRIAVVVLSFVITVGEVGCSGTATDESEMCREIIVCHCPRVSKETELKDD
jgi:hypothetical protein